MYANSTAIKAYRIRTAAHRLQALFTWAYAVDLGQGLGAVGPDLVVPKVDRGQRCIDLEGLGQGLGTLVADLVVEQLDLLQRGVGLQGLRCYGVKA